MRRTKSRLANEVKVLLSPVSGNQYWAYPQTVTGLFSRLKIEFFPSGKLPSFSGESALLETKASDRSIAQVTHKGTRYLATILGGLKNG